MIARLTLWDSIGASGVARLATVDWSYRGALWKGELVNEEIGKTDNGTMGKVLRISANAAHVKGAIGKVVEAIGLRPVEIAA